MTTGKTLWSQTIIRVPATSRVTRRGRREGAQNNLIPASNKLTIVDINLITQREIEIFNVIVSHFTKFTILSDIEI